MERYDWFKNEIICDEKRNVMGESFECFCRECYPKSDLGNDCDARGALGSLNP